METIKTKQSKFKFLFRISICLVLLFAVFLSVQNDTSFVVLATNEEEQLLERGTNESEFIYLSDIDYIPNKSSTAWGSILKDQTSSGAKISVKVEGGTYSFDKGMWAHATSTLVYDISGYDYKYFTAYIGLNSTAASSSNGVKFYIYTSSDGQNWDLKTAEDPTVSKPGANAEFVKIDIEGANYLKLYADSNGSNGNDHSVYADAKLIKETYKEPGEDLVPSITQLDEKIKGEFANADIETNKDYELTLLKREFISRVGNYALRRFLSASEANTQAYTWLTSDVDNLRLFIMGGTPEGGSYFNALTQLSRLYEEYKDDFSNTELLNNKWYPDLTYGELYKKMAFSIALTHSQRVGLWMQSSVTQNQSDALRRYAIFKYMHKNGKLGVRENLDYTPWFEALHVEEMRFIMNNAIDDEEILWLNDYVTQKIQQTGNTNWITPHPHMAYVWPNYQNSVYYAEENRDYFNELFSVNGTGLYDLRYTIPGGKNIPTYEISVTRGTSDNKIYKLWMNFRNKFGTGAVCGGISKSGSNIRATHGIPATVIGQPGHAALLYYSKNNEGKGYWGIDNDVSGWTLSEKGERMLLGWGNASYSRGYSVVYMALSQEVINDFDNLIKCEEKVMLAKAYQGNLAKQEEIYREALRIQPINIDAWVGLINVYNASENKTEDEDYALAEELAEALKCFPLPMQHLTNLIKPKLTSVQNSYKFTLLQTRILTEGTKLPNTATDQVLQPSLTRLEANYLLGKLDKTIATFSFDGVDAGKIVLSSKFDGNGVRWDYCLTGKGENVDWKDANWNEVAFTAEEEHKLQLTPEQIASITAENDIYVHIVGVNYDEKNLYKIDITEQGIPENLYANDLENRVIGVNLGTEWRYNENDEWTSYKVSSPNLTGDKTVQIRQAATGTKLTSDIATYNFTEDNQPDTRKYVSISHLSIHSVSTEATAQGRYARNVIDGNYNTNWHSAWNGTDTNRFITIKLDYPIDLSAVEYVPGNGGNGKIIDGTVYGSMDGENWEALATVKNLTYKGNVNAYEHGLQNIKTFEIEKENKVQYIKIVANRATNGNWFTARMFNIFEDISKRPATPTADIAYSTTTSTNGDVIARLVNPSTEITITNNNGSDTYIFKENGTFTFEFEDENGVKGSAVATVSWIDKDIPTADIKYNVDGDKKLIILLGDISEDVYLLDKDNKKINYIEVKDGKISTISYLDNSGNVYKMVEVDENGITTKVTYKNTTGNVSSVETYVTTIENGNISSEEYFDSEGNSITISDAEKEELRQLQQSTTNPLEHTFEDSGDYDFKLLDKASNITYKNIKVNYLDNNTTILASDITYDITQLTSKNVVATINPYIIDTNGKNVNVEIVNNNGSKTYTFEKNGEFTFEYKDSSDTNNWEVKGHTARVNWIDKEKPTANISYSITNKTNRSVTATLVNESEEIVITNNNGSRTYTFEENGEFTFEFEDMVGNKQTVTATVNWIDKVAPTASISYSTMNKTDKPVTATLSDESEEIRVTNNNGSKTYTFTENGEFTFEFEDMAGNKGTAVAKVDWIERNDEEFIFNLKKYKQEEDYITRIVPKTTVGDFKQNVETNQELVFTDKDGNVLGEDSVLATGVKLKVGDRMEYTLVVTGDIDGNGRLGTNDLSKIKLHYIEYEFLTGASLKAADIDGNGKVSINDISQLKLAYIGLMEIE